MFAHGRDTLLSHTVCDVPQNATRGASVDVAQRGAVHEGEGVGGPAPAAHVPQLTSGEFFAPSITALFDRTLPARESRSETETEEPMVRFLQ